MSSSRNKRSHIESSSERSTVSRAETPRAVRDERVPADEQIRVRAYELYLERGDKPSDRVGDWLRAERELRERSSNEQSSTQTREGLSGQ